VLKTNLITRWIACFGLSKPCIDDFNFLKPIVQVDGTFRIGKYCEKLLTAIAQDGNQNIFPLGFAIIEKRDSRGFDLVLTIITTICDTSTEFVHDY